MEQPRVTLDHLLLQISEILQMIENHKGPLKITPDTVSNLNVLERYIKTLADYQADNFKESQIDIEHVVQETVDSPATDSKTRQFLKRANEIEHDVRVFQLALSKAMQHQAAQKKGKQMPQNGNTKQQIKERRKLFKSIGGDQKWIPL